MDENNKRKIQSVINYAEETLRNSSRGKVEYIDFRNQKNRINTNQNHIVYGRRGAGKTSLLNVLDKESSDNVKKGFSIYINMEDYKDIELNNLILITLRKLMKSLDFKYKKYSIFSIKNNMAKSKLRVEVKTFIRQLDLKLKEPNQYDVTIRTKGTTQKTANGEGDVTLFEKVKLGGKAAWSKDKEVEKTASYQENKLEELKGNIEKYKLILNKYENIFGVEHIFLVLDDFYFIPKNNQYKFIDFFHRITKDTCLYIKIASIKYRTKMFLEDAETYLGTQLNHDMIPIDLDCTLENFNMLMDFMREILTQINEKFDAHFIFDHISTNGLTQLCLASGGVPRDLLVLYSSLLNKLLINEIETIGKVEVTDAAINKFDSKVDAIKTDVHNDNMQEVEYVFEYIRNFCVNDHRCNTFLISKDEANKMQQEHSLIRELMDLRIIHIVNTKTSCAPSDGLMYEAYMIDLGMYPNAKPKNFKQIDLTYKDEGGRKDEIRSSPKISLVSIRNYLNDKEAAITEQEVN